MTDLEPELQEMDPIEAEVYAIRRKIDAELEGMTDEEITEYFRNSVRELAKKGFRFKYSKMKPAKLIPREPDEIYSELEYYDPYAD